MFVSTVESHLASNVNKSRLVQKDLQVAKKLQEEEDQRAMVQSQKQHVDMWVTRSLTHSLTHTPFNTYLYQCKIPLGEMDDKTTHNSC